MALASDGFRLSVTVVDNGANSATKVFDLTAADYAAAVTASAAIMAAFDAVTDGTIKSYSITHVYVEDTLVLPAVGVQVENQAEVVVQLASSPLKKAVINIPAANVGIFAGTSGEAANTVDTLDTALVTFASIYLTGQQATISDGEVIQLPIISGKRVHRASRRG